MRRTFDPIAPLLAWLVGIAVGQLLVGRFPGGLNPGYGAALVLAALLALAGKWTARLAGPIGLSALLLAFFSAGAGRALVTHPPVDSGDVAFYNSAVTTPEAAASLVGRLQSEPVRTDHSQRLIIAVESLRLRGEDEARPVSGRVLTVVARYPEYALGASLTLTGTLTPPPAVEGFDYPAYLARQGVYSYMLFPSIAVIPDGKDGPGTLVSRARAAARANLQRSVPEPQAAVAVGVVTGDRSSLPENIKEAFQRSGTSHILAISGQNIMLLVGVVYLFCGGTRAGPGKGRRMTLPLFLGIALLLVLYGLFTGGSAPVVRAVIMGCVLLFAPVAGRRFDPLAALLVAAAAMAVFDPDVLLDLGFQLSFAALLGITLFARPLHDLLLSMQIPNLVAIPLAAGLAAQLLSTPLVAALTGQFSIVSPFATLSADFALLPLMVAGFGAALLGAVPILGQLFAIGVWAFAGWLVWSAQLWGSLPFAAVEIKGAGVAWAVVYYVFIAMVALAVRQVRLRSAARIVRAAQAN